MAAARSSPGASTGIGSAIALALGAAGAHVAGIYKTDPEGAERTEAGVREHGVDCFLVEGDTGSVADVDRLAELACDRFGGIDIWINNAARLMVKPLLETTDEDWHGLLAANLHGYFYGCRAAGRAMVARGAGGRIINVSSAADILVVADLGAYIAAKGAIVAMTKVLALELADHAITVNAIAPGAIDTPLNKTAFTPEVRARVRAADRAAPARDGRGGRRRDAVPRLRRLPLHDRPGARPRRRR